MSSRNNATCSLGDRCNIKNCNRVHLTRGICYKFQKYGNCWGHSQGKCPYSHEEIRYADGNENVTN